MRKLLVVLLTVVIFFSPIIILVNHSEAQATYQPHFENLKVLDPNNVDYTNIPLLTGGVYAVRFNVVVDINQSDVQLVLNTNFEKVGDTFWKLENDYGGIDTKTWQPGKEEIVFNATKGVASLQLTGRIPEDFTIVKGDDPSYDLHLEKNMTLVAISFVKSGQILDQFKAKITDKTILSYEKLLTEKNQIIGSNPSDPRFLSFYSTVLNESRKMKDKGEVESAINLLDSLPSPDNFVPLPPSTLTGIVLEAETNRPLAKVTVTAGDISVTTEADGKFKINDPTLPTTLKASLDGYIPASINISAQNPYQYFSITLVKMVSPQPPSVNPIFLYTTIVFAALVGGVIALWARSSSRTEYTYRNLDEQAKKLDVVLIKLKRVDSSIAEEINEIKNALLKIRKR